MRGIYFAVAIIFDTKMTILFRICLFFFLLPPLGQAAIPQSSNVPGGVAVIPLDVVSTNKAPPQAWMNDRPLFVAEHEGQWVAVIGLALDMKPGSHSIRIDSGGVSKTQIFEVIPKQYPEQHLSLKDKGKVRLSPKNAARAKHEIARILELKRHWRKTNDTDALFTLPAEGRMSSPFGLRRLFNGESRSPHSGLDVAVPVGTPIKAVARGSVLAVDDYFFNGKTIFLDHGNGLITMYCHLDQIGAKVGDEIAKGQDIGTSGQTGRATGPHLHWSVVLNGNMVDPELFLTGGRAE